MQRHSSGYSWLPSKGWSLAPWRLFGSAAVLLMVAGGLFATTPAPPAAAQSQSDDATLSALTLDPDNRRLRPAFMGTRIDYFAWYPSSTSIVTVAATPTVSGATLAYTPADSDTNTAGHQVSLSHGKTTVTVTVTATNGTDTQTYTVKIVREHPSPTQIDADAIMTANMTAYVWPPRDDTPDIGGWSQLNRGKMSNRTFELQGTGTEPVPGEDDTFTGYRMLVIKVVVNDWREYGADTVVACFAARPTVPAKVYRHLTLSIATGGATYEFPYRDATAFDRFAPGMCWQWARPAGLSFTLGDLAVVKMFAGNIPARGTVTVPDSPEAGTAITATVTDVTDIYNGLPDPIGYTWQWVRVKNSWVATEGPLELIKGATSATYTPTPDDIGKRLLARVRFADGAGHMERMSARTGRVTGHVPLPTPQNWSATLTPKDLGNDMLGCDNANSSASKRCSNSSVLSEDTHIMGGVRHTIHHFRSQKDEDEEFEISIRITPAVVYPELFGTYLTRQEGILLPFPASSGTSDDDGTTFTAFISEEQFFTADENETVKFWQAGDLNFELSLYDFIEKAGGGTKARIDLILDQPTDADPSIMASNFNFTGFAKGFVFVSGAEAASIQKIERITSWSMPMGNGEPRRVSDHFRITVNAAQDTHQSLRMSLFPSNCSEATAICTPKDTTTPSTTSLRTPSLSISVELPGVLSVSVGDATAVDEPDEDEDAVRCREGTELVFPITLSRRPMPGWHVRVDYATTDEGAPTANRATSPRRLADRDYSSRSGTMTWFTPTDASEDFGLERNFGVGICPDDHDEPAETLVFQISNATIYDRTGEFARERVIPITDDRATGVINANTSMMNKRQESQNTPQDNKDQKSDQQDNSPATGEVRILGTVQVGETLSASAVNVADEDGMKDATFAYQWLADDAAISGAASGTYTLADDDEGKTIRVRLSFTDDAGNAESLTSAATAAVQPRPNRPATGAPTISGSAQVGETLTASTAGIEDEDGLDNAAFTYQWLAGDQTISGATDSTLTLTTGQEGNAVKVTVSFSDDRGHTESLTSAATDAVEPAAGQQSNNPPKNDPPQNDPPQNDPEENDQQEPQQEPPATEPPGKPIELTGTLNADGSITLSWTAPEGEVTGYQVLRRRPEQGETSLEIYVDDTGSAATTWTDANVTGEGHYVYRVKARNEAGLSPRSNFVKIDR